MNHANAPAAAQPDELQLLLPDEAATHSFASRLASWLEPGWVIHLSGTLGAGKTSLCRGLLRSLGYNGRVKSPTYTLVEPYNLSGFTLYHFDFYRFSTEDELRDAGFEEWLDSDAVALVEWPEMAARVLPEPDLLLRLALADDDDSRRLSALGCSARGRRCLAALTADPMLGALRTP